MKKDLFFVMAFALAPCVSFSEEVHRDRPKLETPRPVAEMPKEDKTEDVLSGLEKANRQLGGNSFSDVGEQILPRDLETDRFRSEE